MMLEDNDVSLDVFGLAGTFPRPGWVVLDAARQHGFTGELTFETIPPVKVYLDGGSIYLAERVTDPSLGSRLIDAGALNAAQLEHGSMMVGDVAHLGRLFERVPSVNRQTVMVMTEMMTEECVGWLAGQMVSDVETAPYRHHPAGVQRWLQPASTADLAPGDPLPSPAVDESPAKLVAPEPLFSPGGLFDDGLITWDQRSWLDEPAPGQPPIDLLSDAADGDTDDGESGPSHPASVVVADVAAEPETIEASASPAWWLADPSAPVETGIEVFEPLAASETETIPKRQAFAAPDPSQVVVPLHAERTDSPRLVEPPVIDLFAVANEPADSDVEQNAAVIDFSEVPESASAPTVSDDWADLVAAVTEPELEPLPIRTPSRPPTLDQPEQLPDLSTVVEAELAPPTRAHAAPVPDATQTDQADRTTRSVMDDWVDRLDADGLPETGSEPLMSTKRLPARPVVPADRFELIWPSGETDEQFGSSDSASTVDRHPDLDRAGPTARLGTATGSPRAEVATTIEHDQSASELTYDHGANGHDEITDEVVLAVRRAVASIETSSLDARRRLITTDAEIDPSRGIADRTVRSLRPVSESSDALIPVANSAHRVPTRSVFDDDVTAVTPEPALPPAAPAAPVVEPQVERVGALRRLIGSLRRR